MPHCGAHRPQQPVGVRGIEVPDVRTQEHHQRPDTGRRQGQTGQAVLIGRLLREHVESGHGAQRSRRPLERLGRHVDQADLQCPALPCAEQRHQLLATARPELDNHSHGPGKRVDVARVRREHLLLDGGNAVPREMADGFEQRGTEPVVEVVRGQPARRPLQVFGHLAREG